MNNVQVLPKVSFKESIKNSFSKYCSFKGRVRRSEFWPFYFFILLIILIPTLTFILVCLKDIKKAIKSITYLNKHHHDDDDDDDDDDDEKFLRFWPLIVLGILILIDLILSFPLIPLCARRLHDVGKSGCYLFLGLIPVAGIIAIFIFCAEDSQVNSNEYGPSPKYVVMEDESLLSTSQVISVDGTPYINTPSMESSENNSVVFDEALDQGPIEEDQEESDISRGSIAKPVIS